ncbi:8774_t:CDS:2 [Cetraspora pellucida]|uniref:8774_t:CDS:1 n=1 Tax=Cetraspora pellucida TaxID=1433469 RepID=A0A9N9HL33_9GLOM|nr:8774_t:CDS:2 [Cetraspora pellucida]
MKIRFIFVLITLLLQIFYSGNEVYAFLPAARYGHNAVLVKDRLYFYGGSSGYSSYNFFYLDVSKSFDLTNTSSMHWTDLSFVTSISRTYGASVVNNNSIYFFSGSYSLSRVDKFDTLTEQWVTFNFSGNAILASTYISSVQGVISNNTIYFFGGSTQISITQTQHDLILVIGGYPLGRITSLNIKTFLWANITALNDGFIPGLYYHTATLINNYVIIAYGNYDTYNPYYPTIYYSGYNNNISLLDINQKDNYKWVNSYVIPNNTQTPTSLPTHLDQSNDITPSQIFGIVGGVIGIISGLVGLVLVSFVCYTYHRNNLHDNNSNELIVDHYPVSSIS